MFPFRKKSVEKADMALLRQVLWDWFDQPLGRSLQAIEISALRDMLPKFFGTVSVQLGRVGRLDYMDACNTPSCILLDSVSVDYPNQVRADVDTLPFASDSVDLVLLPHILDFANEPHQILREAQRVLSPEGHLLILGFNPYGLWGLWRLLARRRHQIPWQGNFVGLARIKDWLSLLDFDLSHGRMLYYRPPLQNEAMMERLRFMDALGNRWWPMAAAVYMVVAKKRVAGMTPLRPVWEEQRRVVSGLAEPAAKVIYPRVPQWRLHRGG